MPRAPPRMGGTFFASVKGAENVPSFFEVFPRKRKRAQFLRLAF
jgi:hypothetical protein